jgi:predicted nuclease with TOPRIM domain
MKMSVEEVKLFKKYNPNNDDLLDTIEALQQEIKHWKGHAESMEVNRDAFAGMVQRLEAQVTAMREALKSIIRYAKAGKVSLHDVNYRLTAEEALAAIDKTAAEKMPTCPLYIKPTGCFGQTIKCPRTCPESKAGDSK